MKRFTSAIAVAFATAALLAVRVPGRRLGLAASAALGWGFLEAWVGSAAPVASGLRVWSDRSTSTTTPLVRTRWLAFDRHADGTLTAIPGSPFAVGGAGTGAGIMTSQGSLQLSSDGTLPARRRWRQQPDFGCQDPSGRFPPDRGRRAGLVERRQPGQHRRAQLARLRRKPGHVHEHRRNELHRLRARPVRRLARASRLDRHPPGRGQARRCPLQRRRHTTRRYRDRQLGNRQLHRRLLRAPESRAGLAVLGTGLRSRAGFRTARKRVQPHQSRSALRVGRAHRRR